MAITGLSQPSERFAPWTSICRAARRSTCTLHCGPSTLGALCDRSRTSWGSGRSRRSWWSCAAPTLLIPLPHRERRLDAEIVERYGPDRTLTEVSEAWRPYRTWAVVQLRALRGQRTHEIGAIDDHRPRRSPTPACRRWQRESRREGSKGGDTARRWRTPEVVGESQSAGPVATARSPPSLLRGRPVSKAALGVGLGLDLLTGRGAYAEPGALHGIVAAGHLAVGASGASCGAGRHRVLQPGTWDGGGTSPAKIRAQSMAPRNPAGGDPISVLACSTLGSRR